MARSLQFSSDGEEFSCAMEKVDRDKLYGWVDKKAFDRDGNECHYGSLSADGMHIFSSGSFEQGYLASDGRWLGNADLQVVDAEGKAVEKQESSFNKSIALDTTVPIDTYLMHVAKSIYHLQASPELIKKVSDCEDLYAFPFNYYASHNPDTAFLIASEGELFMVIGQDCGFEFLQRQTVDDIVLEDDEDEEDEDEIDFGMF